MRLAASGYLRDMVKLEQLDDVRLFCSSPSDSPNRLQLKNEYPITVGQGCTQTATCPCDDRPFRRERQGHPRANRRVRLINNRAGFP
jgi:hypothetical protein